MPRSLVSCLSPTLSPIRDGCKMHFTSSGPLDRLQRVIPAVSSRRCVVDGYVRVGPNRWSRHDDVSGV